LQRLRFLKLSPSAPDRRSQRPNLFLGTLQPLLLYWLSVNWKFAFGALAQIRDGANH
jgi:hypothetical protein